MGWSRAWTLALHARLRNGTKAEADVTALLFNLTHDSLLDAGPPASFQIDGNLGGTAGVAEALLQSHEFHDAGGEVRVGLIRVLPALLPSSEKGHFTGFLARGGFVVSAEWVAGKAVKVVVESKLGGKVGITAADTGTELAVEGGGEGAAQVLVLDTEAGKKYSLIGLSK